jgi:hypothetical protein
MKFISVVFCLSLLRAAAAESCPDELPGKVELTSGFALHYGILETDQALCGKLVSDTEAWVGFGAQPEGVEEMVGAHAIIALPLVNTVQQYILNTKTTEGIEPTKSQSLTETSVTQEDGTTVAAFKQLLSDDGFELSSNNVYLMAKGFSNDLGYHVSRGFVALDFENNVITSLIENPTTHPSLQPSPPSFYSSSQPSTQPSVSMQSSSKPSQPSTGAPFSGDFSSNLLVTANTTSYPSSQPSTLVTANTTSYPSSQPSTLVTTNTTSYSSSQPSTLVTTNTTSYPSSQQSTLVTTNTTLYSSSQPSTVPSSQSTSYPSSIPSAQASSRPSNLPSAEPSSQTLDTSSPSSASFSQLTNDPSSKPASNLTPEPYVPRPTKDNDPTSYSERKVVSMALGLGASACTLFAAVCC